MVFVYIIYTSKLQQGNKVIFQKLHTCTKIKNKTKGKKTIQKRTINTSPSKKAEKNPTKQNCILKFAHKSDLTIYSLEIMRIHTIVFLDFIRSIDVNAVYVYIHSVTGGPVCLTLNKQLVFMS